MTYLDYDTTKKKIKELANANGYSVADISRATGLSTQAVYAWYSHNTKQMPAIDNLVILAGLFRVSLDDLIACDFETEKE